MSEWPLKSRRYQQQIVVRGLDFDAVCANMEDRDPGLPKPLDDLFPDRFVDSEQGDIPEGWDVKTISDLAEIIGGSTPRTTELAFWNEGVHH